MKENSKGHHQRGLLFNIGCLVVLLSAVFCISHAETVEREFELWSNTDSSEKISTLSHRVSSPVCPRAPQYICDATSRYRSYSGACNNLRTPWWGQSNSPYKRLLSAQYDDGLTEPRTRSTSRQHTYLPNARTVANDVFDDSSKPSSKSQMSLMLPYFAQLVSYDISDTAPAVDRNGRVEKCKCSSRDRDCFSIPIPKSDKLNKDQKCMSVVRSLASVRAFDCSLGPREQLNKATHWLDLSILYGSTEEQANKTRTFTGGQLKSFNNTRTGDLYFALNQTVQCKYSKYAPRYFDRQRCYITGDNRTEDNAVLLSLLTIFLRQHNSIASELATVAPLWNDEKLYQEARRIVIAIYQNIIYSEFIPAVIGREASISFGLPTLEDGYFTRYSSSIYPQVNNEFATAASRIFQTMLPLEQSLIGKNKNDKITKSISYFQFNDLLYEKQMNPVLRGVLTDPILPVKPNMNKYFQDWLWNELFYDEDTKRWSLSALNIQQGRDHGLAGYNKYRRLCGLREARSFSDLTNIPDKIVQRLKRVYSSVDDIDLYVGLVSERPLKNALVGQTAACIIGKQFRDLKFGDRFYFENDDPVTTRKKRQSITGLLRSNRFPLWQLKSIRSITFGNIITRFAGLLQSFVFFAPNNAFNPPPTQTNYLNLTLWADDNFFNCSNLFTTGSTQASFSYSPANSSDLKLTFSYSSLQNTGLSQSTVDVRCFPFNQTAIITITGNQPTVNLQLSTFGLVTSNASLIVYVKNFNSVDMGSTVGASDNSSSLALRLSDIPGSVAFASLNFEVYEESKVDLHINNAGSVTVNGSSTINIIDQSVFSHSVINANSLLVGTFSVLTNSTNGFSNQTQVNVTIIYDDISSVQIDSLSIDPKVGGSTKVVIDNIDNFLVTSSILIYPSSSTGLNVNSNVNLTVHDVHNATVQELSIEPNSIFNLTLVFDDIQYLHINDGLSLNSNITNSTAFTNADILFQNIERAELTGFNVNQQNSGSVKLKFVVIDTLTLEGQNSTVQVLGTSAIDVAVSFSQIKNVSIDKLTWNVPSADNSSRVEWNVEKIGNFSSLYGIGSNFTQPKTSFRFVDIRQASIFSINVRAAGAFSNMLFDTIDSFNLTSSLEFYAGLQSSSDRSLGNHTFDIKNIGPLNIGSNLILEGDSGSLAASVNNVSQLAVIGKLELLADSNLVNVNFNLKNVASLNLNKTNLISQNSSVVANFGPGIPNLFIYQAQLNTTTNTSNLAWNLFNITQFNVTDKIQGGIESVVNVSLFSVANTTIAAIEDSVISSSLSHLFFKLFDLSNFFQVVTQPSGAGTRLNTINETGCSCSSIASI